MSINFLCCLRQTKIIFDNLNQQLRNCYLQTIKVKPLNTKYRDNEKLFTK